MTTDFLTTATKWVAATMTAHFSLTVAVALIAADLLRFVAADGPRCAMGWLDVYDRAKARPPPR
jgi:hypothetical protein